MTPAPVGQAKNIKNVAGHRFMSFLSCLLAAGLLIASFPQLDFSFLMWVALVPLCATINGQRPWRAFRRAYLCGFLFFAATVGWVCYVTYVGAFLLVAFLALYFALFGMAFIYFQRLSVLPRIFVLSACWVALEFIRAHFLGGFDWVRLGHSQYKNLWLIQIASITGVYGVSFLVVLVNLLIFENWRARSFLVKANLTVMVILALVLAYGLAVTGKAKNYPTVRVGVIQPNIPLAVDWDDSLRPWIIDKNIWMTRQLKDQKPDLIIWPETSLPGVISESPFLVMKIRATAADLHTPLLIGSIGQEGQQYFNSAFLIGADGQMLGRYDKIHLVPFGEYLPLRPVLGWIGKIVGLDDFNFGKIYKVFTIAPGKKFSALICFEDTLGDLRRQFTREGALFFVNMTNDAWFQDTKAPFLQLQAAVFGCVETHRALARAANTGVSALVDPWGRITAFVHDGFGKKTFIEGGMGGVLPMVQEMTFYTKYGDVFTYLCFLCILLAAVIQSRRPYG